MSDIEGKAAMGSGERGGRHHHNQMTIAKQLPALSLFPGEMGAE